MISAPKIYFEANIYREAFKIILIKSSSGNAGRKVCLKFDGSKLALFKVSLTSFTITY